ncbi:MAG: restriction endonuclease subunit S [Rhizobiales bacterium PAR1]|nr:MAG: restriction endonuclease subunit S [Rhizobiales bacterium PAR1]
MGEWRTRPLSDFVDPDRSICYGIVQPGSAVADGVPIVRVNNFMGGGVDTSDALKVDSQIESKYRRSRLQGGELLITLVGSMGLTAIASEELRGWNVARAVGVVPLRADADKRWINFVVRSKPAQDFIRMRANTTVQATFNLKDLAELPIPCPPDAARIEMSAILSSLDDKIELNRRMNETLEAMSRAIFKDWFVDFGPTRAKMEGRAPYLAPDIWSLFPDRLDEEGKPEGWIMEPLLDHARLISGGTPKTDVPAYWGGDIAWASAKDVSQCTDPFLIGSERTITEQGLSESSTRLIPKLSTVVVARGATTGRFCMLGHEMAMNQTCYALASTSSHHFWLNCAFASLVQSLVHAAHGSVFDTITTKTVEGARVTVPDSDLLGQFEIAVTPLFDRMLVAIEERSTLAATRDFLLPKLMSGEVRVKDAEKLVGAAL